MTICKWWRNTDARFGEGCTILPLVAQAGHKSQRSQGGSPWATHAELRPAVLGALDEESGQGRTLWVESLSLQGVSEYITRGIEGVLIMLSKDDFARRIALIQNFHSEQQALGALIDKLTDGYPVVTLGDNLIAELIAITAQELNDNDDFISWWLWEDVEKVVWVGDEDKQREISVRTVEELYDFLTEQMEG